MVYRYLMLSYFDLDNHTLALEYGQKAIEISKEKIDNIQVKFFLQHMVNSSWYLQRNQET